jgi:hypothetical protein
MSRLNDLTGKRFGEWTVLRLAARHGKTAAHMMTYWLCRCSCGTEKEIAAGNLTGGKSTRCDACRRAELNVRCKAQAIPMVGKRFNGWTVVKEGSQIGSWLCRCDCGTEGEVFGGNLRRGLSKGCAKCYAARRTKDLTGKRFRHLLVVGRAEFNNGARWMCECDCPKKTRIIVKGGNLLSGSTKSCGCLQGQSGKTALQDLTGKIFGWLRVQRRSNKTNIRGNRVYWQCFCDPELGGCGKEKPVNGASLRNAVTKSCGCMRREITVAKNTRHGHAAREAKHPEYAIWSGMIKRCCNEKTRCYPDYGGRGIRVCDRWRHSFPNFLADMGPRPEPRELYSIDRIDPDGNYEPGNCKWAVAKEQVHNRRPWKYRDDVRGLENLVGMSIKEIIQQLEQGAVLDTKIGAAK